MPSKRDLTGMRFARLTVVDRAPARYTKGGYRLTRWNCICDCGKRCTVDTGALTSGNTKSCGCRKSDATAARNRSNRTQNRYDTTGDHGIGYTKSGKEFLFSLEDLEKIKPYKWSFDGHGYLITGIDGHTVQMHRFIMDAPPGMEVDHINGDRRDNRRGNLRLCTRSQNCMNRKKAANNTSGAVGVYQRDNSRWYATIKKNQKTTFLGSFDSFEDALKARQNAEIEYFGEYRKNR